MTLNRIQPLRKEWEKFNKRAYDSHDVNPSAKSIAEISMRNYAFWFRSLLRYQNDKKSNEYKQSVIGWEDARRYNMNLSESSMEFVTSERLQHIEKEYETMFPLS